MRSHPLICVPLPDFSASLLFSKIMSNFAGKNLCAPGAPLSLPRTRFACRISWKLLSEIHVRLVVRVVQFRGAFENLSDCAGGSNPLSSTIAQKFEPPSRPSLSIIGSSSAKVLSVSRVSVAAEGRSLRAYLDCEECVMVEIMRRLLRMR